MVQTVMKDNKKKDRIISTSFTFDEIVNLLPIIFDFKLSGSQGFPSQLTTGTFNNVSLVVANGLSKNVSKLHEYLYGEKNYEPTANVHSVDSAVANQTGISESSAGYDPIESGKKNKQDEETATSKPIDDTDYDYDDKGKSEYY